MTRELVTGLRLVMDCFILVVNDPPTVRALPEDAKDGDGRPKREENPEESMLVSILMLILMLVLWLWLWCWSCWRRYVMGGGRLTKVEERDSLFSPSAARFIH